MNDAIQQAAEIRKLARSQRAGGEFDRAVTTFRNGIDSLRELHRKIAEELTEFYGMLGGTLREQGNLAGSIEAYDSGFHYESNPEYQIRSSYNATNRLVTRVLLCPDSLSVPEALRSHHVAFVNIPEELSALISRLQFEISGSRFGDYWAFGDLATACALNGDNDGASTAAKAFGASAATPIERTAYKNAIEALAALESIRKGSFELLNTLI